MKIELCMGSSCFARGNALVLEALELYVAEVRPVEIVLTGHLCLEDCANGPNIKIGDTIYHGLKAPEVIELIEQGTR